MDLAGARQLVAVDVAVRIPELRRRMNAFEQCVKTSSISIRSPSFGTLPSTADGSSSSAS